MDIFSTLNLNLTRKLQYMWVLFIGTAVYSRYTCANRALSSLGGAMNSQ